MAIGAIARALPESIDTLAIGLHVVLQRGGITLTESVHIDHGTEIVQFVERREGQGFPDAPFRAFT